MIDSTLPAIKSICLLLLVALLSTGAIAEAKIEFKTVEWTDLMPEEDLQAILNPPAYVTEIEDGSADDQITSQFKSSGFADKDDPYQRALVSTKVVEKMNNQAIRIPGFIVPLEVDEQNVVTEFFLVPFFGACIHVPPPPPNQIIYIKYPKGIKLESLYDAFWISGILKTSIVENDMAESAYSLEMKDYEYYEYYE